ncbi:MAG: hypothetical protein L6V93_15570 [Clostridiales bacterium]|nr:MAG: hypothetical protein L6V93_15570 [Clostridiales bacterium]
MLTGRYEKFSTIRQMGGLSGFPKPSESEYDAFAAGHASTSVSAALGMRVRATFSERITTFVRFSATARWAEVWFTRL